MNPTVTSLISAGLSRRTAYRRAKEGSKDATRRTPSPPATLGGPVAELLSEAWPGVPRTEWARRLGVTRTTLWRWLHGVNVPADLRERVYRDIPIMGA